MRPSLTRRPAFSSAIPRLIVLRAIPVAAETAVTPPNPMISASFATNNRRPRSSRCGTICSQRARMPSTSIITQGYYLSIADAHHISILFLRSLSDLDSFISHQIPRGTAAERNRTLDALHERYYCRILDYLQAIHRYPPLSKDRYLIVAADPPGVYVQCLLSPDRGQIFCEAASARYKRPVRQLVPSDRLPQLAALGFDRDPGDANYQQQHRLIGAAELARFADLNIRSFYYLYGISPDSGLSLKAALVPLPPKPRYLMGAGCHPLTS